MPQNNLGGTTPRFINEFSCNPYIPAELTTRVEAQKFLGRSKATIDLYVRKFGLGRRIGGKTVVSRVALQMFADGNMAALGLYLRGDRTSPVVVGYFDRCGVEIPASLRKGA